nr:extracellular solute-binding protein [Kibdelosporangium sp. MJ126-NF4]CEL20639.1 extracellular solute-binding protein, family 1 [Kibdelosporangium sp. MJ126-NF4]CTQ89551.1 extracellular solute-binding protein, family 1 [Kibdelosporangium sp. MJ126-NF4]
MNNLVTRRTLLGSAMALPLLSACGAGARGTGAVRFEGWDYESQLVQQNLDRFSAANTDIKVAYTPITSAQYVRKIVAEFTGNNGPDVLYSYDDSMASWVQAGYLQPIDGLPGVDEVYRGIYEANAQAMTFQGKRYGLPYYTDSHALIYNSALLEKAGITTPPKSLDELEQQALKVKNAGVLQYPIGFGAQLSDTWASWVWTLLHGSGEYMFTDDFKPSMAGARGIFDWIHKAATVSKVIDPASLQLTPVPLDNAMMASQYAFTLGPRYALRMYNDPAKSKQAGMLKLAPVPSLDGTMKGTVSSTRMYCLSAKTEVKDQAVKLLNFLGGYGTDGTPSTARFWFDQRGLGFPFKALADDPAVKTALAKFADPEIYNALSTVAKPRNVLGAPWYSEYETAQQKTVQQLLTNQTDATAATASLSETALTLAKKYS